MEAKVFYKSKTFWFNVIMTIVAFAGAMTNLEWVQANPQVAWWVATFITIANGILRGFTKVPLATSKTIKSPLLFAVATCFICSPVMADGWTDDKPAPEVKTDAELCKQLAAKPALSWKEARKLGISFRDVRLKLKDLKAQGKLDGLDRSEISALVMEELVSDNPKLFENVDWDRVLHFIEMILKIIAIFGAL